jgi:hypothetical protein
METDDIGMALLRAPGWDWGTHVRAGMLFGLGSGAFLRVRGRTGGRHHPDAPDPHDVLLLLRRLRAGSPVRLVVDDPATHGWLLCLGGVALRPEVAAALLEHLGPAARRERAPG